MYKVGLYELFIILVGNIIVSTVLYYICDISFFQANSLLFILYFLLRLIINLVNFMYILVTRSYPEYCKCFKILKIFGINYSKSYKTHNDLYSVFYHFPIPTITTDSALNILCVSLTAQKFMHQHDVSEIKRLDKFLDKGSLKIFYDALSGSKVVEHMTLKTKNKHLTMSLYIMKIFFDSDALIIFTFFDASYQGQLENNFVHLQKIQAIGEFATHIIHDFNNLLTAIVGFTDMLLIKPNSDQDSYNNIMQIRQNAVRSTKLIQQLLLFSRKGLVDHRLINASDAITALYHLIYKLLGSSINLSIEHKGDPCYIKVDQGQFEQIIINLSVNARDAMPNGGSLQLLTEKIYISHDSVFNSYYSPRGTNSIITEGEYVLITVHDTGVGIDHSVIDKIFEPFFSTKSSSVGTGLGLATVCDILDKADGYLRLKTDVNLGTSFYVFLKFYELDFKEIDVFPNRQFNALHFTQNSKINNISILIVEDEDPVRLVSVYALKNAGYNVIETNNCEEAVKLLHEHQHKITLVITDISITKMNGSELIRFIKKFYPNIKVIITSGYSENNLSCTKEFYCNFLSKPYSLQDLLEMVTLVVENYNI
ncbi:response regulator [Rickettsia endosymbiont of Cardiosporidium cionae]|uniref:response regulator n=1 Tax=Rickettsia endosymbiont of Cardiosporidium cionae TaxID=2777155 RepID=UPI00189485B2|nr:response regulator [Rickettsia endosymbiont of Cardiosporidium cionae]KAF8818409.1 Sensor histidine kinase RcsC [Rickettsia endosymbiont of Cardiosporidium cionae]